MYGNRGPLILLPAGTQKTAEVSESPLPISHIPIFSWNGPTPLQPRHTATFILLICVPDFCYSSPPSFQLELLTTSQFPKAMPVFYTKELTFGGGCEGDKRVQVGCKATKDQNSCFSPPTERWMKKQDCMDHDSICFALEITSSKWQSGNNLIQNLACRKNS